MPLTAVTSGNGGPSVPAALGWPYGLAADGAGNLYIADTYNNRIRKVSSDGTITTVAGRGPSYSYYKGGYSGDGGRAVDAEPNQPHGVAVDAAGNMFIADTENFRVRKVTPDGIITTVAGNGTGAEMK
jgi:sugar lactone lactonase YvrE